MVICVSVLLKYIFFLHLLFPFPTCESSVYLITDVMFDQDIKRRDCKTVSKYESSRTISDLEISFNYIVETKFNKKNLNKKFLK